MERTHLDVVVIIAVYKETCLLVILVRIKGDFGLDHVVTGRGILQQEICRVILISVEITIDRNRELPIDK